ncbi:hypothetical protein [Clostridium sp. LP20]
MKKIISYCCAFFIGINIFPSSINVQAYIKNENTQMVMEVERYTERDGTYNVELNNYDSYEIINNTGNNLTIRNSGTISNGESYNCLIYNTLGNIKTTRINSTSYITLQSGERLRINSESEKITLYVPNSLKETSKVIAKTEVFTKLKVQYGENYEFKNNTSTSINILTTSNKVFDIVYYDIYNKVKSFYKNREGNIISNSGESFRISQSYDEVLILYIPQEHKDLVKKVENPAIHSLFINSGENYEVISNNEETLRIKLNNPSNISTFDMARYDDLGKIEAIFSDQTSDIAIKPSWRGRISVSKGDKLELYMPSEFKNCYRKSEIPALKEVIIRNGETYEVTGNNNEAIPTNNNSKSKSILYDLIKYNDEGFPYYLAKDDYGDIKIDKNNKIKVTTTFGNEMTLHIPYEYRDSIKPVKDPALHSFILSKGDNYQFTGDKIIDIPIKTSADTKKIEYDIIKFDDSGKIIDIISDFNGWMSLKANHTNRISLSTGDSMVVYMPYEFKNSYKKVDNPALQEVLIKKGETYEFTAQKEIKTINNSSYSGIRYDIVSYTSSGNLSKVLKDEYGNINIQEGHRAKFTTSAGVEMIIHIPYEYKDLYKKIETPALYEVNIGTNEYYEINNNRNSSLITVNTSSYLNGVRYDYTRYDGSGNMSKAMVGEYGNITLAAQERLKIGTSNNVPLKLYVPYENKELIKKIDKSIFKEYKLE